MHIDKEYILNVIKSKILLDFSEIFAFTQYKKEELRNSSLFDDPEILDEIERNQIKITVEKRNDWLQSESANLQIKGMQLVASLKNYKRLTGTELEHKEGEQLTMNFMINEH